MASKAIRVAVIATIVVIAGYWYWSPFIVVRQLQSAAQKKDADAFNAHVDYPKIRESLKQQASAVLADKFPNPAESDNELASAGAAIGNMIGMVVANQFIDAMVKPETVMQAMRNGQLPRQSSPQSIAGTQSADKPSREPGAKPKDDKPSWSYERQGVNKLIAFASNPRKPEQTNQEKLGLVLQRSGFANWTLTEVRLPALNK